MHITVTPLFPSGSIELSALVGTQLVRRTYAGYTRREARQHFRDWIARGWHLSAS